MDVQNRGGRTDGQTDGQIDSSIPPPPQKKKIFVWCGYNNTCQVERHCSLQSNTQNAGIRKTSD